MAENRNINYDLLRIMACLMIVIMHSPIPNENVNGLFLSSLSYLSAPGVGLFFMISGALLLPIHIDFKSFFLKRFLKIAIPLFIWNILYLLAKTILFNESIDWIRSLLSLPFSASGSPVFWFLYTLMGLYLLAPILSRWFDAASKKEIIFYLAIWGISLCIPFLRSFAVITTSNTSILYYFSGYVGYFVLGYFLKKYPNTITWKILLPALFISIALPIILKLYHIKVDFYDLFWYLSIFVVIQCIGWWKLIKMFNTNTLKVRIKNNVVLLSNLTFGIFLIHIFIMRYILWHCDFILQIDNYYIQTAVVIILTFIISALCTYVLSLLPKAQYIVGFKNRRSKA